ncbi:helix-turn-helix transcriptional regulator [uncultured Microbacterium sp.]|uniref:helix-turn-helix domain-containing protein n=1 Tax=uncultured Microbacterium sp. TaxID=191216 RepID=UPI0026077B98|nr:helix-turn-helix transcriptional regulator [uncultured Microbacterium sp.]
MPKKRKAPVTFDEWVGAIVENHMNTRGYRQEDLAEKSGMSLSLLGRSIRGTRPFTVTEFETVAGVLDVPAARILEDALAGFGGMRKLLAEQTAMSPTPNNVSPMRGLDLEAMTPEAREELGRAAVYDAEHEEDEPHTP